MPQSVTHYPQSRENDVLFSPLSGEVTQWRGEWNITYLNFCPIRRDLKYSFFFFSIDGCLIFRRDTLHVNYLEHVQFNLCR